MQFAAPRPLANGVSLARTTHHTMQTPDEYSITARAFQIPVTRHATNHKANGISHALEIAAWLDKVEIWSAYTPFLVISDPSFSPSMVFSCAGFPQELFHVASQGFIALHDGALGGIRILVSANWLINYRLTTLDPCIYSSF